MTHGGTQATLQTPDRTVTLQHSAHADGVMQPGASPAPSGQAAALVARCGLQVPALMLLEVASPFRLLIQQALLVAQPILSPWAGDRLRLWASLLDDDRALEDARRRFGAE